MQIFLCFPFIKFGEQINVPKAVICVLAAQIANLGESMIGAALQEKEGFRWVGHYLTQTCIFSCIVIRAVKLLFRLIWFN